MIYANDSERFEALAKLRHRVCRKVVATLTSKQITKGLRHCFGGSEALTALDDSILQLAIDHVLHRYHLGGKYLFERALENPELNWSPEERQFLEAGLNSTFTLLRLDEAVPNLGVNVYDLLNKESFFLTDKKLASIPASVERIITRCYKIDHLVISSGLWLPVGSRLADGVCQWHSGAANAAKSDNVTLQMAKRNTMEACLLVFAIEGYERGL